MLIGLKVQEKGKFPSQPHQNPKGIHEVEAQEGESSKVREVKAVITLRSDMIKQVPTYAKFLKDLCIVKKGLNVNKKAFLTEQVSPIIQCKSLVKYKDPGCPTISVRIEGTCVEKALLDLGANRSVKILRGMIEHVLVQVDKFYCPVDFVVLDTDPLNIFHLYKKHIHPEEEEGLEEVCMIDTLMEEHCDKRMQEHLIESFGDLDEGLPEPSDLLATLPLWRRREEILPLFNEEETQRVAKEEPPKLILKPLPTKLKCKKAIGWQISNSKGINPLVCTHHIYMEDEAKPVCQPQRRLNPHMQEVVRAEVLKLLQVSIIYLILDSHG
ncbi:hypothetical protein CK203_062334 [Vitis vinifera]|uniref:Aspartic peptidase DDI1-type domain-containing protein n=1 Tax=Vitis vinifera TaxID=29760 RepID=A0A438GT51_VITVI|nr:hypothetical protein CK203_062334 [Vitis vinifera]